MQTQKEQVVELVSKIRDLKCDLTECNHKLCTIVETYQGTLIDGLRDGIIRLNFAAPSGFKKHLLNR